MFIFLVATLFACSDWTPIKNARDFEGQHVKVKTAKSEVEIEELVMCDDKGFIIANAESDCRDEKTFDIRHDKVSVHEDNKTNVGYVVAVLLAAVLVPAGIAGTAILSGGIH